MNKNFLLVDQFSGLTPYALQKNPDLTWDTLVEAVDTGKITRGFALGQIPTFFEAKPEIKWATTLFGRGVDGKVEFLGSRWDTSG